MTRGRESNEAYIALDRPDDSHAAPSIDDELTARTILHACFSIPGRSFPGIRPSLPSRKGGGLSHSSLPSTKPLRLRPSATVGATSFVDPA